METRTPKQPGPDHPITLEPTDKQVIVRLGDEVIADSSDVLLLHEADIGPVAYFPREHVRSKFLTESSDEYYCPYKGECTLYDLGDKKSAAWSYENPHEWMSEIKGRVAFDSSQVEITGA